MKILKYLIGILAFLIIGFILIGVIKPTISYGNEIEVNKPVQEAWAVMTDESKTKLWLTDLKSSELLSGKAGEVGAVSKIIMAPEGEDEMVITETITANKKNEHMGFAFDADVMKSNLDLYFFEKNGKIFIRSNAIATGKGMIWKSIFAISKSFMLESDLKIMNNLKKVIEENTTDYFPQPKIEATEMDTIEIEKDASKG